MSHEQIGKFGMGGGEFLLPVGLVGIALNELHSNDKPGAISRECFGIALLIGEQVADFFLAQGQVAL